jgi:hypothetical protein
VLSLRAAKRRKRYTSSYHKNQPPPPVGVVPQKADHGAFVLNDPLREALRLLSPSRICSSLVLPVPFRILCGWTSPSDPALIPKSSATPRGDRLRETAADPAKPPAHAACSHSRDPWFPPVRGQDDRTWGLMPRHRADPRASRRGLPPSAHLGLGRSRQGTRTLDEKQTVVAATVRGKARWGSRPPPRPCPVREATRNNDAVARSLLPWGLLTACPSPSLLPTRVLGGVTPSKAAQSASLATRRDLRRASAPHASLLQALLIFPCRSLPTDRGAPIVAQISPVWTPTLMLPPCDLG